MFETICLKCETCQDHKNTFAQVLSDIFHQLFEELNIQMNISFENAKVKPKQITLVC